MALWVPASQVPGLMAASADTTVRGAESDDQADLRARSRRLWAGVAAMVLLGLIAGVAGWKWAQTKSKGRLDTQVAKARTLTDDGGRLKARLGPVEQLLEDAWSAVRVGQLERAARLLEEYVASPLASQANLAKVLLRDIKLAGSVTEAAHSRAKTYVMTRSKTISKTEWTRWSPPSRPRSSDRFTRGRFFNRFARRTTVAR